MYADILSVLLNVLKHDNLGRLYFYTRCSGPSNVFLRSQKFNSTTIATHVTDIIEAMGSSDKDGSKPVLFLLSDNGPNFNPMSLLNSLFFYQTFEYLDLLCTFTYAAQYSAYNCIEHLWAPLSNKLASVILSSKVLGDSKPPAMQGTLSNDERRAKENIVFDNAMNELENVYWNSSEFDGFPVLVKTIECGNDDLVGKYYEQVKEFLKSPIRDTQKYSLLRKEFLEMFTNMDWHKNEIVFIKCNNSTCCKEFRSKDFKEFLLKSSVKLRALTPSNNKLEIGINKLRNRYYLI